MLLLTTTVVGSGYSICLYVCTPKEGVAGSRKQEEAGGTRHR